MKSKLPFLETYFSEEGFCTSLPLFFFFFLAQHCKLEAVGSPQKGHTFPLISL